MPSGPLVMPTSKAFGQLKTGRGSAIKLAENMKQLGVTPASGKQMPAALLQLDHDEDE